MGISRAFVIKTGYLIKVCSVCIKILGHVDLRVSPQLLLNKWVQICTSDIQKVSACDKEIPQSQTAGQPTAP